MPLLPSSLPTSFSRINLLRPLILKLQRTDILLLGRLLLSNKCRQRTHTRLSMRLEEENARIPLGQHPRFIIFLRHWIRDLIVIRPPLECVGEVNDHLVITFPHDGREPPTFPVFKL